MKKDHKHYQVWREWLQAQLDGRDFEVHYNVAGENPRYLIEEPSWIEENDYKIVYKDKYTFDEDLGLIFAKESKFPLFNTKEEALEYRAEALKHLGHPDPDSKHMPVWREAAKRRLLGQKVAIEYFNPTTSTKFRCCGGTPMWLQELDYRIAEERYSVTGGRIVADANGITKERIEKLLMEAGSKYMCLPEPHATYAIDLYCSRTPHLVYTRPNGDSCWKTYYREFYPDSGSYEFIVVPNPGPVRSWDTKKDRDYWVVKPGQGICNMPHSNLMAKQCGMGLVFDNRDAARVREDNINFLLKGEA
jgi:hypothetical protein